MTEPTTPNSKKRKPERSEPDHDEGDEEIDINDTLAARFVNKNNKDTCFAIIKQVFKSFGTTRHTSRERDKVSLNTNSHYNLMVLDVVNPSFGVSDLESILKLDPSAIRNVHVIWPKMNDPSCSFSIDIEVFNKEQTPHVTHFKPMKWRNNNCKDTLKKLQVTDGFPVHWSQDIDVLSDISDYVYNMEEFLPQITSSVAMDKSANTYQLTFENMVKVSYDFIEFMWKQFSPRIIDITFAASGTLTRTMTINIAGTGYVNKRQPLVVRSNTKSAGEDDNKSGSSIFRLFKKFRGVVTYG